MTSAQQHRTAILAINDERRRSRVKYPPEHDDAHTHTDLAALTSRYAGDLAWAALNHDRTRLVTATIRLGAMCAAILERMMREGYPLETGLSPTPEPEQVSDV